MSEALRDELQATLDMIPAFMWYAAPSGALLFVNSRSADYLGLPKDHQLRFGTDAGAAWDSHIPLLHPDDREETRRVWSDCLKTGCPGEVAIRAPSISRTRDCWRTSKVVSRAARRSSPSRRSGGPPVISPAGLTPTARV
jgi:PAS domain-containing protein